MPAISAPPLAAEFVDVLIIGGGINGCGIARDLAGRGLRVILCEQHDLAAHTSSASTKLIHGGLRYLEYGEFGLVRKALAEREVLLRMAPHLVRPLRFVMPHDPSMRAAWMIRAGLWLYDHLARRRWLPASGRLDLRRHPAGQPLQAHCQRAFHYADAWADDARLVVLNAYDAALRGAAIHTRTRCTALHREAEGWQATLQPQHGPAWHVRARAVVNAAGPWAEAVLRELAGRTPQRHLRLVRGSHIVVRRWFAHDDAYLLQASDRRVVFVIPYLDRFTLIGTTDVEHHADPAEARIDEAEIDYLCREASRYFRQPVRPSDVVWHYSGVRPLLEDASDDPSAVTRDYVLDLDTEAGAPLLTVWGGKITTFRTLAQEAAHRLRPVLGLAGADWTAHSPLPGGDLEAVVGQCDSPMQALQRYEAHLRRHWPWLADGLIQRWSRAYGTLALHWLRAARHPGDLGAEVAPGMWEAELRYLVEREWARSADDVAWRRTKLGLAWNAADMARTDAWVRTHVGDF